MEENGNKNYPVRTLTVENFSVIKHAKLEFGKITVLIGPQASGKSLLCKLAYFLGKELVELAVNSILNGNPWDEFLRSASIEFSNRFFGNKLASRTTTVAFESLEYKVVLGWSDEHSPPSFEFGESFVLQYKQAIDSQIQTIPSASGAFSPSGISSTVRQEEVWIALNRILSGNVLTAPTYIPAGRAFFTNAAKGFALFQNPGIDPITREFAAYIQWDSRWKVGLLTTGRGVTDEIDRLMTAIAKGFVMVDSGAPRFIADDGRKLPLEAISTGVQEMVPLYNVVEQLMYFREHRVAYESAKFDPPRPERPPSSRPLIYLEEPEANIFPETQYALIQLFAWLARDPVLNFSWVITTHSPYVLSAFNNLIYAGQLGEDKAVRRKIPIETKYRIEPGTFAAYSIHDGKCQSILSKSGLIDGEYLDSVSEKIGNEFDSLLRLEYDKTKAS